MPEITLPQAIVLVGLVFAWLVFVIARAYFESGGADEARSTRRTRMSDWPGGPTGEGGR